MLGLVIFGGVLIFKLLLYGQIWVWGAAAPFIIAAVTIISLSLFTVLSQTVKAARTNIVDNLKEE